MKPLDIATKWLGIFFLACAAATFAQEKDINAEIRQAWSRKDFLKDHIKGYDSPDGKLAFFEIYPGVTTSSFAALASPDGSTFRGILPVAPPNTNGAFTKSVVARWSPDSKYLAIHENLAKHSELILLKIENDWPKDITPKDIRAIALRAAGLQESMVKNSGQLPERWVSFNILVVQARFAVSGKTVVVPVEVEIGEDGEVAKAAVKKSPVKK